MGLCCRFAWLFFLIYPEVSGLSTILRTLMLDTCMLAYMIHEPRELVGVKIVWTLCLYSTSDYHRYAHHFHEEWINLNQMVDEPIHVVRTFQLCEILALWPRLCCRNVSGQSRLGEQLSPTSNSNTKNVDWHLTHRHLIFTTRLWMFELGGILLVLAD